MRSFVFVVVRSQGLGSAVLDYQKTENSSWIFQSHRLESWRARTGQFGRELHVYVMDTDLRWWAGDSRWWAGEGLQLTVTDA